MFLYVLVYHIINKYDDLHSTFFTRYFQDLPICPVFKTYYYFKQYDCRRILQAIKHNDIISCVCRNNYPPKQLSPLLDKHVSILKISIYLYSTLRYQIFKVQLISMKIILFILLTVWKLFYYFIMSNLLNSLDLGRLFL